MNSKHTKIKLTFEAEDLNSFPFLDVKNYPQKQTVCYFDFSQSHISLSFYSF